VIESVRSWGARHARLLLVLLVLGFVAFQLGRVLRMERTITGGGISLPLDDSFIYLQYARALAEGHPFVYTPGNKPTTGATSLAYPLLLAPSHLLHLSPELSIAWALALGVLGYVLSALLLVRLGARLGGWVGGVLAPVLFLASPYLMWGYWSGMEVALYATVLLVSVHVYLSERGEGRFPSLRWWLFALAASRPEGAILCSVFGLLMARDRLRASRASGGPSARSAALLLPFAATALPFLVNLAVGGSIESTSSQAKSILAEPYKETRIEYIQRSPEIWGNIVAASLSHFLLDPQNRPIPRLLIASLLGVLLFLVFGRRPRDRPWDGAAGLLALLGAGVIVNSLPVWWQIHLYRYQQGIYTLLLLVMAAGWGRLAWWVSSGRGTVVGVLLGSATLAVTLGAWLPILSRGHEEMLRFYGHNCENILHQQVRIGRWIDANLPRGTIVGLNDAGAIAYYGHRSTLDLVGLTTSGFVRVYRSGLGCLFEHLRRLPPDRLPTYFAIYPEWFPYWRESGILGPEAFRAHLGLNTIAGGSDMVVYPASWIDVRPTDAPVRMGGELEGKRLVDSIDLAWLEDERRHDWRARPEAKDVLRRYAFADVPTRPLTDAGRIVRGEERFRAHVIPGKDLVLVMRTDSWYPSRLDVSVDGKRAGIWSIALSETVWVEPRFTVPGSLLTRGRPEFAISRLGREEGQDYTPFHYWLYQAP
jgi:hypothetical protein